jgi:hypothetical protein
MQRGYYKERREAPGAIQQPPGAPQGDTISEGAKAVATA